MIAETIHLLAYRIHFVRQLRQRNRGNSNPECAVCDPDTTKSLRNGIRKEKRGNRSLHAPVLLFKFHVIGEKDRCLRWLRWLRNPLIGSARMGKRMRLEGELNQRQK